MYVRAPAGWPEHHARPRGHARLPPAARPEPNRQAKAGNSNIIHDRHDIGIGGVR